MRLSPSTGRLFILAAVAFAALGAAVGGPTAAQAMDITIFRHAIAGSGKHVDVTRRIGAFSRLQMEGPIDVDARPAATPGVIVHADDNVEPLIETVVDGATLTVRPRKGASFRSGHKILVEITFPVLAATRQSGSGDLHVSHVEGARLDSSIGGSGDLRIDDARLGNFTLGISGSGDVTIAGHADEAHFAVSGSGDVDAMTLSARRVDVSVAGSGDVRTTATESLAASVAGSGDVVYDGHPHEVSRQVAGSGSIRPLH